MNTSNQRTAQIENQKIHLLFVSNGPSLLVDPYNEIEFSKATMEEALNKISASQITTDAVVLHALIDDAHIISLRKVTDQNNLPLIFYTSAFDHRIKDMALTLEADDYLYGPMIYTFASQTKFIKRLRAFKTQWLGEQKERRLKNYLWLFLRRTIDIFFAVAGLIFCSPFFVLIALVREIELIEANVFSCYEKEETMEKLFHWYEFLVLILFSPIFLLITMPLKIRAKDKYLFSTEKKVGLGNRVFDQYKFTTEVKRNPPNKNQTSLLGSFLIKTSLVHLPYLLNILMGDISIFDQSEEGFREQARVKVHGFATSR